MKLSRYVKSNDYMCANIFILTAVGEDMTPLTNCIGIVMCV